VGKPKIIFCTAYDQYAIDAFEVHAVDYLLKPVSRARLAGALERVRILDMGDASEKVVRDTRPSRFLAKRENKFKVIPREAVLYFLSEGGLTQLWTSDTYYWMEPSLNDLERRLEESGFYRLSRQALVKLDSIVEVIPLIGGHGRVKLSTGQMLEVSRRRMRHLMERLERL
jgi:DNA-binding LytR/AlgR family response regulator